MPTSATGRSTADCPGDSRGRGLPAERARDLRQRGFTLLEVLVALLIAAVLAGSLVLAIPDRSRSLRFEADRLAQLMAVAREEAILRSAPVRFVADEQRYQFAVWQDRVWRVFIDDPALRPREWAAPTGMSLERADGQRVIEFGREQIDVPFRLRLVRDSTEVIIRADGMGSFRVE